MSDDVMCGCGNCLYCEYAVPLPKIKPPKHNHFTRDIKEPGKCPSCDLYWETTRSEP